ncbi:MAG: hypothetical protein NTZ09_10630 [Candidatus Hydrogenedentes bacterium]|nr:hypothetical protein [Candidatus Hydrogenedentota bacterium]
MAAGTVLLSAERDSGVLISYRKGLPRSKVLDMLEARKEELNADVAAVMRKLVLGGDMIA